MAIPAMVEALTGTAGSYAFEGNVWSQSLAAGSAMVVADVAGDTWLTWNAFYDGADWQRVDTSRGSFAIQVNLASNMIYESYKAMTFWHAQAGSNPIGDWATIGGWELVCSFSEHRNATVGGAGWEMDGFGTVTQYGYGRVRHATVGGEACTDLLVNSYLDDSGRDTPSQPSWRAGFTSNGTTDKYRISRAPGGGGSIAWADLVTLSSAGVVFIKNGTAPGSNPSGGGYLYVESGALKFRGSGGTITTIAPA